MTKLKTSFGRVLEVDRDYMGAIGEDVRLLDLDDPEGVDLTLTPDEADELADALKHHAAEVRQINKENDRA